MIRYLRVLVLRVRAWKLEGEIANAEGLLFDHRRRLQNCQLALRRIRAQEAMLTPASTLLEQAMRGKG